VLVFAGGCVGGGHGWWWEMGWSWRLLGGGLGDFLGAFVLSWFHTVRCIEISLCSP
jgi:hypothetical protein